VAPFAQPNTQVEVTRLQKFDGSSGKVAGFITACKLYICMKMREVAVSRSLTRDFILFFLFIFILLYFSFFF